MIPPRFLDLVEPAPKFGALATIGADGFPQVTAVGFVHEGAGRFRLSMGSARQKTKNLLAHPECTLFILDPQDPFRAVEVRARAVVEPDPDYSFADRMTALYGVVEDLRGLDHQHEGSRCVVTLEPVKVNPFFMAPERRSGPKGA